MRILMISPYFPWPLYGGSSVRMFNIIRELSQRGHRIVLVAGKKRSSGFSYNPLSQLCEKVYFYKLPLMSRWRSLSGSLFSFQPYPALQFRNRELYEIIHNLLKNEAFDLVWINFLFMANFLLKMNIKVPVVLDQHEADELVWKRYIREGNLLQKFFSFINLKKVQFLQKRVFKKINALFCVSKKEAEFMESRVPSSTKVRIVPNGVDTDFFKFRLEDKSEPIILFLGAMCVKRNVYAVLWFVKKIFPQIKKVVPTAQFWIAGSKPGKEIFSLEKISGIKVIGTVEDVRLYYEKAKVFVAPFRFGEGTRLKLLEVMAMGIPIVSTREGCQGIDVIDGKHILIAIDKDEFAKKVIELLFHPEKSKVLAEAARLLVAQKYNWKAIVDALVKCLVF